VYADSYGPNGWDTVNDVVTQSVTYKQAPAIAANQTWVQVVWEQSPVGADTDLLVSIWDDTDWRPPSRLTTWATLASNSPPSRAAARGSCTPPGWTTATMPTAPRFTPRAPATAARPGAVTCALTTTIPPATPAPALVGAGPQVVHVVWGSTDQDYGAIYYDRSADSGVTWEPTGG
jgi:hypothetical protein